MTVYSCCVGGRWAGKRRCSCPFLHTLRKGWNIKTQCHKKILKSIVCFLIAPCPNDKLCCSFSSMHPVRSHGYPASDGVFSAYVLPSISSCVASLAILMGKCPKILHSCVDLNCQYFILNGSTLEELTYKFQWEGGWCKKVILLRSEAEWNFFLGEENFLYLSFKNLFSPT